MRSRSWRISMNFGPLIREAEIFLQLTCRTLLVGSRRNLPALGSVQSTLIPRMRRTLIRGSRDTARRRASVLHWCTRLYFCSLRNDSTWAYFAVGRNEHRWKCCFVDPHLFYGHENRHSNSLAAKNTVWKVFENVWLISVGESTFERNNIKRK